jgi:hypothetical protein
MGRTPGKRLRAITGHKSSRRQPAAKIGGIMAKRGRPRKTGARYADGKLRKPTIAGPDRQGKCALYILSVEGSHACKIGISTVPARRCDAVQSSMFLPVRIFWAVWFGVGDARRVEAAAHRRLKSQGHHARGEWFNCGSLFARGEVLAAAEALGVEFEEDADHGWGSRGQFNDETRTRHRRPVREYQAGIVSR